MDDWHLSIGQKKSKFCEPVESKKNFSNLFSDVALPFAIGSC